MATRTLGLTKRTPCGATLVRGKGRRRYQVKEDGRVPGESKLPVIIRRGAGEVT